MTEQQSRRDGEREKLPPSTVQFDGRGGVMKGKKFQRFPNVQLKWMSRVVGSAAVWVDIKGNYVPASCTCNAGVIRERHF